MKLSFFKTASSGPHPKKPGRTALIVLIWLGLWQAGAWSVGNDILLVGPFDVLTVLIRLLPKPDFWLSIAMSFGKISLGFLAAFFCGLLLGWAAFFLPVLDEFLAPAISFMKSVPVASFVILALIWMGSENLSVLIAFLVVFPTIYVSTIAGLKSTDQKLLEMAEVFRIAGWRRLYGLYWPSLLPYLMSSCKTALGMSWKSGIAAEVIGVPDHTIGEQLYLAKIYLSTAELFAWTLVIILASLLFEKVFLLILGCTEHGHGILQAKPAAFSRKTLPDHHTPEQPAAADRSLIISGLSKSYGALMVLNRLTLHLEPGRSYCVMGPSGSGKTTFFNILMGLEPMDSGSIRREGQWRTAFTSAVFQENRLCESFSPIENIRLAVPEYSKHEIAEELSKILPAECLTRPVSTLSGGMKRRTAIARALLASSDLIIMDEPFTGLDEETKQIVIQYILEKSAERMLIFSTHLEEEAAWMRSELIRLS